MSLGDDLDYAVGMFLVRIPEVFLLEWESVRRMKNFHDMLSAN
jgi:hypothetical protein